MQQSLNVTMFAVDNSCLLHNPHKSRRIRNLHIEQEVYRVKPDLHGTWIERNHVFNGKLLLYRGSLI